MYTLPRTVEVLDSMYLFSPDWHHLSQEGHNTVAEGVMTIMKDVEKTAQHKDTINAWDDSFGMLDNKDQCDVWFSDGKVPFHFSVQKKVVVGVAGVDFYYCVGSRGASVDSLSFHQTLVGVGDSRRHNDHEWRVDNVSVRCHHVHTVHSTHGTVVVHEVLSVATYMHVMNSMSFL